MTAKFRKTTITIPNRLHGDRTVPAYCYKGVAVAKVGRKWGVFYALGGFEIYHKLQRQKLADAKKVAEAIANLNVDWTLAGEDKQFIEAFKGQVNDIRQIAESVAT